MALNFGSTFIQPKPLIVQKPKHLHLNLHFSPVSSSSNLLGATAALSEGTEAGNTDQEEFATYSGSFSSARTRLDLLEQLTSSDSSVDGSESDDSSRKLPIRDQLTLLVGDRDDDFSIPLGRNLKKVNPKLTISQKRNIKRQSYLNEVSRRNDSAFFATIGAFVLFPPLVILGIAVATGYVQLLP